MPSTVKDFGGEPIRQGSVSLFLRSEPAYLTAQILLTTLSCAVFCTIPKFRVAKYRNIRAVLFATIGWYGCLPMKHLTNRWGREKADEMIGWNMMFMEGLSYGIGAAIYSVSHLWN